jgi:hypothetical protein
VGERPSRRAAVALVVAVPLLLNTGASAQAPPGPPAQQLVHFVVFLRGDTGTSHDVDVGKKGPSPGDFTVALHGLYDPSTKKRIGSDIEQAQVVHLYPNGDGWVMLHATAFLPDGHI